MSDFFGEWLHRGCGGNLIIEIVDNDEDVVFKLKCTKCPYEVEFARLVFEEDEGGEE